MILSLCVQFTRLPVMNSRLGMIMLWLSPLMIVVARMLMRSILPVIDATVTTSPTRIGRSSSRMIPLTKFDTISCKPKPSPDAQRGQDHADLVQPQVDRREPGENSDRQHEIATEREHRKANAGIFGHPRVDD